MIALRVLATLVAVYGVAQAARQARAEAPAEAVHGMLTAFVWITFGVLCAFALPVEWLAVPAAAPLLAEVVLAPPTADRGTSRRADREDVAA